MTQPNQQPDDSLPMSRVVRWMVLGGIVLFSVGLYFKFGLHLPRIGTPTP
ncbi:MAG TPA: hypothetical protein VIV83_14770 [Gemmatimonadales bacterium]|jgi:hypothetical protein